MVALFLILYLKFLGALLVMVLCKSGIVVLWRMVKCFVSSM